MEYLIWAGALVSLTGLAGLIWVIVAMMRARREGLDDASMRERIKRLLPLNLGALFLSVIGLMLVVVGILLG